MRALLMIGVISLSLVGEVSGSEQGGLSGIIETLGPYVEIVLKNLDEVSTERKEVLDEIASDISSRLLEGQEAMLTYICTHNSRRSHMAQLWALTAATYYGLEGVTMFSGGTEATECNIRTVAALRRAGFSVVSSDQQTNPVFLIQYSDDQPPMKAYSKLYNESGNPSEDFIALMCCSQADMQCPVVGGATSRFAIHYVDPKESDDTDEEMSAYDSRCREIAMEMFYLMSQVKK